MTCNTLLLRTGSCALLLVLLMQPIACSKLDASKEPVVDPYAHIPTIPAGETPLLPMGVESAGGDNCEPNPVSGCLWALSHDSVVYGKLVDMRLLDEPAFRTNPVTWEIEMLAPSVCDFISPIFEVDVAVARWAGVEPPSVVTIRMGPSQYGVFRPVPFPDGAGNIYWENTQSPRAGEPLEIGQMLGAGVHYYPEIDRWGLAMDTLFAPMLDSDGREIVAFPPNSPHQCEGPPLEWSGLSVDELFDSIAACADEPEAKARHANNHDGPPAMLYAHCNITPIPYTYCQTDADCKVPEEGCAFYHKVCVAAEDVMSEDLYVIDPLNP
ncbi:MAG: hypothetical protein COW42_15765 [Deltaproteobacteria bacterium CG17_big_fil_post_rev_8_21_14_2_50_63_7]|nr:MAG: hypothetical protein COW42_15765 [Deltaproteobacteria bacterium CG17_big_fil_post_rev_8_21_14_2_50_63_7]